MNFAQMTVTFAPGPRHGTGPPLTVPRSRRVSAPMAEA